MHEVAAQGGDFVHPAPPVTHPHVHSAFSLLTPNEGY
jgi:hypothetical protein